MCDPVIWTIFIFSKVSHIPVNLFCIIQIQKIHNWTLLCAILVERVLVLHSSGPASPISIMVVLRRTTRGLQQAFRAVTPALQPSSYYSSSSSRTWVTAGEGGKGSGWGGGTGGERGIRGGPCRRWDPSRVESLLGWICAADCCIPGWGEDWRRGHVCGRASLHLHIGA